MKDYLFKIIAELRANSEAPFLISPFIILAFFVFIGAMTFVFHLPEQVVLTVILLFFTIITVIQPFNGLFFILLSVPFFLGESGASYYWLTELFIYGALLSYFARSVFTKKWPDVPFKYQLALLIILSTLSVPLGAREYVYQFWSGSLKDIF